MDWIDFYKYFLIFWFVSFPLTIALAYFLITEVLDLIFNTNKISKLLKHSDSLNTNPLEKRYQIDKFNQANFSKSNLMELDRQINYLRLTEKESKSSWTNRISYELKGKITAAKRVADIFKTK